MNCVVLLTIFGSWKPRQGNALTDELSDSKQSNVYFFLTAIHYLNAPLTMNWD
jgi:hypothetical protein